jgi:GPH family glycoside/pentoside/hexuronide:cation symporter
VKALEPNLSIAEKLAYALGDGASSFYWKTFEFFLLFYYTDVYGIPAGSVATMLLITRIGDAAIDPFMGALADRTHTRWGSFRPYLLWFSVPLATAGVLTFTTPNFGTAGKLIYAYITYSILMLAYTAINIPYTALMGVLTPNSQQRTSASSWRFTLAFLVTVFVQKYTLSFVRELGNGHNTEGWQRTMGLYGFLAVAMFLICFSCTKERVASGSEQRIDGKKSLQTVLASKPWRVLFASVALILAAYGVRGAASAYYFKYFLHREDLLGLFLTTNGISALAGILVTPALAKAIGKKLAFILCCLTGGGAFSILWIARPGDLHLVFAVQILSSLLIGPIAPLFFAMFADVADHAEMRTSKRQTGLFFASAMFAIKFGAALGTGVLGLVLSFSGYVSNSQQTALSLHFIALSMSVLPGALLAIAGILSIRYELTESAILAVESTLRTRSCEL